MSDPATVAVATNSEVLAAIWTSIGSMLATVLSATAMILRNNYNHRRTAYTNGEVRKVEIKQKDLEAQVKEITDKAAEVERIRQQQADIHTAITVKLPDVIERLAEGNERMAEGNDRITQAFAGLAQTMERNACASIAVHERQIEVLENLSREIRAVTKMVPK